MSVPFRAFENALVSPVLGETRAGFYAPTSSSYRLYRQTALPKTWLLDSLLMWTWKGPLVFSTIRPICARATMDGGCSFFSFATCCHQRSKAYIPHTRLAGIKPSDLLPDSNLVCRF